MPVFGLLAFLAKFVGQGSIVLSALSALLPLFILYFWVRIMLYNYVLVDGSSSAWGCFKSSWNITQGALPKLVLLTALLSSVNLLSSLSISFPVRATLYTFIFYPVMFLVQVFVYRQLLAQTSSK